MVKNRLKKVHIIKKYEIKTTKLYFIRLFAS